MTDKYLNEFGLSAPEAEKLLKTAVLEIEGQIENSSNTTLLVNLVGSSHKAIFKPIMGERPLHDFAPGLHKREVAAYELTKLLNWPIIPPTVVVEVDKLGEGSLQLFVDADFSEHYFTLVEKPDHLAELEQINIFDALANNTDRKSSHCLLGQAGVWAIDQGLCFHLDYKLRTVIWDFAGQPITTKLLSDLEKLSLSDNFQALLTSVENQALEERKQTLLTNRTHVVDETGGHRYPWPPI